MKLTENLLLTSRNLRKNQTPWENKLWYNLRAKRFKGHRFRRQFVIGGYIVDLCCFEKKLIIELDGSQHNEKENKINDLERTKILEAQGFKVLRFWNNDIDNNLDGVLEVILNLLETTPLSPAATSPLKGEMKFYPPLPGEGGAKRREG